MSRYTVYPSFLFVPPAVHRLHVRRCRYGGYPMTASRRRQLKADWACDGAYGKWPRHTSGRRRPLIIKAPVGTKREVVWRALTRDTRKRRVMLKRAETAAASISSSFDEIRESMADMAGEAARTADTINDALLTKVSRVEVYDIAWNLYQAAWRAQALSVAAIIVSAALFAVLMLVVLL